MDHNLNDPLKIALTWQAAAEKSGHDTSGFDPLAPYELQEVWAIRRGFEIGVVYAREQLPNHLNPEDQIVACVEQAAGEKIFCPAQLICLDSSQKGRITCRKGFARLRQLLAVGYADVLLVYDLSTLCRESNIACKLIESEVVECGNRAILVKPGIDTNSNLWRTQLQVRALG